MTQNKIGRLLFCLIFIVQISGLYAQTSELRGKVTYKSSVSNSEPLQFANLVLLKDSVQIAGNSSDIDGYYIINSIKPGIYDLRVSYIGFKDKLIKGLWIGKDTIYVQNISLDASTPISFKEVIITTYSKPLVAADEGSSGRLTSEEIRKSPTRSVSDFDMKPGLISMPGRENPSPDYKDLSGILTAGVLNDFSKWELWQDVTKSDLKSWQKYWAFKPLDRYTVQVVAADGRAVPDCEVSLVYKDNKTEWTARTDNTGKAELWANLFADNNNKKGYSINVNYKGGNFKATKSLKFNDGINIITLPATCEVPKKADVMFVVDATGSMSDEIEYLKGELNNIILEVKKQNPALELNLGSVFYRDKGDIYVTLKSDFSSDINSTINFIKQHSAGGGGDEPEAVHTALNEAINNMKWSDTAMARLLFLVLDAPPHYSPGILDSLQTLIKEAAAKGIRVIPITGSGIDKSAEYLMRAFALATNGTYVFLTDHSNIGNPHIKPTTDEYDVELLKDVLLHIFSQYLFMPSCTDKLDLSFYQIRDTMYVQNPKIIAHEIGDSLLVGRYIDQKVPIDTNSVSFVNPSHVIDVTNLKKDSGTINIDMDIQAFNNFRYFPNPTTGRLNIEIKGEIDELYLADISGKLLERYRVKDNENLEVNISKYPVGVYFLQYLYKNKWLTGKVILTH